VNAYRLKAPLTALLAGAALLARADATYGQFHAHEVKNILEQTTVNDLHITFKDKIGFPEFETGGNTYKGTVSQDGLSADWDWHPNGWSVPPQGIGTVKTVNGAAIDVAKSYWTKNGTIYDGSLKTVGQAPDLYSEFDAVSNTYQGFAVFTNPENFPVLYSHVQLYKDNNLNNYNIDVFEIPTGTLIKGLPRRILLNPGQSKTLALGVVQPGTYLLGLAYAGAAGQTDDAYGVATANAVTP
jgi:hypothetical protein